MFQIKVVERNKYTRYAQYNFHVNFAVFVINKGEQTQELLRNV
jgi:hypothetical protein